MGAIDDEGGFLEDKGFDISQESRLIEFPVDKRVKIEGHGFKLI